MSSETEITPEQIDALLPFLAGFEADGFRFGEWYVPEGQFPSFSLDEGAGAFLDALYENGWIVPIDWPGWEPVAEGYVASPELLGRADAETGRRLLTLYVRKDRCCEGHLAAMFESGHITALLRRLGDPGRAGVGGHREPQKHRHRCKRIHAGIDHA